MPIFVEKKSKCVKEVEVEWCLYNLYLQFQTLLITWDWSKTSGSHSEYGFGGFKPVHTEVPLLQMFTW